MGLFSIKSRSDSSHYPPFSNQHQKEKKKEDGLGLKNEQLASTEVTISGSLKAKLKAEQFLRKKVEDGVSLLQLAEEGLKNIKEIISNEKNFDEVRKKIEEICETTTFGGKKILDNKEGHQEFLKYFSDFQIDAPDECKFAPNLSPSCLKLNSGIEYALEFLTKQENLVKEKKELILNDLDLKANLSDISQLLRKTSENLSNNQDLGIKSQTELFTKDLLKII